jgi:DNA (cytosine-5)-methyltransferase 1
MIPIIDVFAGPGGLGEGFTALGQPESAPRFRIRLSIEKDFFAHRTLVFRTFFRQFHPSEVPAEYYALLRGEIQYEAISAKFPAQAARAEAEAWQGELGKTPWNEVSERICAALGGAKNWVLIGGPPCQPYSQMGRSRLKAKKTYRLETDERHGLYRAYLHIIAGHWPAVFVMENVKGFLSSALREQSMFEPILEDLEDPVKALGNEHPATFKRRQTYKICSLVSRGIFGEARPEDFVVKAEVLGVPQARHRVIILGIRDDLGKVFPGLLAKKNPVPAKEVLVGMPPLRSGLSGTEDHPDAWVACLKEALNRRWLAGARRVAGEKVYRLLVETLGSIKEPSFGRGGEFVRCEPSVQYLPEWFLDPKLEGVCNHRTRLHMLTDLHRYLYAACFARVHGFSPTLSSFPPDLLPDHRSVAKALENGGFFDDRFRVQVYDRPATTVTSHMAKDGHYYIHPDPFQCRSLTVREAARLQTFPDNYFFFGPRTAQYTQVGNAVPPLMAKAIAERVWELLKCAGVGE